MVHTHVVKICKAPISVFSLATVSWELAFALLVADFRNVKDGWIKGRGTNLELVQVEVECVGDGWPERLFVLAWSVDCVQC